MPDDYGMQKVIRDKLFPEFHSLLSAKDPLPAYAVRLLDTLLEHWPRCGDMNQKYLCFSLSFKTWPLYKIPLN